VEALINLDVAPQRLGMPPLLSDFVFFVSFVAYSSWYPIRTANQTSQLPNFQLQVQRPEH